MPQLIAAPGRQLFAWSTYLAAATLAIDVAYILVDSFNDSISPEHMVVINAALVAGVKILNLIKQSIPATEEQKEAMVAAAEATPVKEVK